MAVDYAFFVAGAECQRGLYVSSGGQPAHQAAWEDLQANALTNRFFIDTRETLDRSWIRPRFAGYVDFQTRASEMIHACIQRKSLADECLAQLEDLYAACVGAGCRR